MDSCEMCCQILRCRASYIPYLKWICAKMMTIVRMEFALSMNVEYYYKQTQPKVESLANHLVDN
jgi:hypothetical protein